MSEAKAIQCPCRGNVGGPEHSFYLLSLGPGSNYSVIWIVALLLMNRSYFTPQFLQGWVLACHSWVLCSGSHKTESKVLAGLSYHMESSRSLTLSEFSVFKLWDRGPHFLASCLLGVTLSSNRLPLSPIHLSLSQHSQLCLQSQQNNPPPVCCYGNLDNAS